jgi:NAD-dependent DNA ligase
MREIVEKIVAKYDSLIAELEQIDLEHKQYLQDASATKNVPATEVDARMKLARDNRRRLQTAVAEREYLIENYLR